MFVPLNYSLADCIELNKEENEETRKNSKKSDARLANCQNMFSIKSNLIFSKTFLVFKANIHKSSVDRKIQWH